MLYTIIKEHWDRFRSDPRWAMKFVAISLALSGIGKLLLVGADTQCGLTPTKAQFVPILPMFVLTYVAHRYLWGRQNLSITTYVGGLWSATYAVKLLLGHGAYTVCTSVLGMEAKWQYLLVSSGIGIVMAGATFALNERMLGRRAKEDRNGAGALGSPGAPRRSYKIT